MLYYCGFGALWNVGYPFVNVCHLALVNELSYSQRRRDRMVNGRISAEYLAIMLILVISLLLFMTVPSDT